MGPKPTTIHMCFIHNKTTQVGEKPTVGRMLGQQRHMQHVRIGQNDLTVLSNGVACVKRRVSVLSTS